MMSKTILFVEDDADLRASLCLTLRKRFKFNVVEAVDGNDALRILKDGLRPDLVITDYLMELTGEYVVKLAKDLGLPVVMLTGNKEEAEKAVARMRNEKNEPIEVHVMQKAMGKSEFRNRIAGLFGMIDPCIKVIGTPTICASRSFSNN